MLSLNESALSPRSEGFLDAELDRLQAHFGWVVEVLRAQRIDHLAAEARAERMRLIGALEAYAHRGVFPRNPLTDRMAPTFVDEGGRECAVAHLMLATGDGDLVESLRRSKNLAHVAQMLGPELTAWARAAGFTAWEVAFIQPDYCPKTPPGSCMIWVLPCNPNEGCACVQQPAGNGTSCGSGEDLCKPATCQYGECVARQELDCDDGDPETVDSCDPEVGCVSAEVNLPGSSSTSEDGCAHEPHVPDGSLAPVLAGLFVLAIRRRTRGRR